MENMYKIDFTVGLFGLIGTGISVKEKSKEQLAVPGVLLSGTKKSRQEIHK